MSQWLPRQQPGVACEECRKRKLRCDRQRPRCGTCVNTGLVCLVNTDRLPRGPKKGSLKALKKRITSLEGQISTVDRIEDPPDPFADLTINTQSRSLRRERDDSPRSGGSNSGESCQPSSPVITAPASGVQNVFLTELMRADLDQLYFDRVHATIPIIHKYRYYIWVRQPEQTRSRVCLRNAMWTLAMSHSSQFENMRDLLYNETRQMLEERDSNGNDINSVQIEHVQAWILLTFYEFLRSDYQRAWLSAGRVFRLVCLLRLHELDSPTRMMPIHADTTDESDDIAKEEKRRVFWVAYCLDRFISVQSRLPLTLNEEIIFTHLPCLESEFETGQAARMYSLTEALDICDHLHTVFSPTAECAVLATLYGRVLSHHHTSNFEQYLGTMTEDFWCRHQWIDSKLQDRERAFSANYSNLSIFTNPTLLLIFMLIRATKLYLYKIMESMSVDETLEGRVLDYQNQAVMAAKEIANVTKEHTHMGYFNSHVFMPVAIFLGAERLITQRNASLLDMQHFEKSSTSEELEGCLEILRKMQGVNNLAKHYLKMLDLGELSYSHPL